MAKFSVCRIYKVTLWLNFSYNYSVNLLQILHLYIHPSQEPQGIPSATLKVTPSYFIKKYKKKRPKEIPRDA